MKILRLDLRAFGPFTEQSLDLSCGNEGFHLIYGPNEAGKSSALRALRQLFYGIPATSTDNFVHAFPRLRIGGLLRGRDGATLECVRRKGNKNTLQDVDDAPLDEAVLQTFLGGVDRVLFETMFGIDHVTLVEGGQAIVQGGGEVGRILFAAGASIADLRGVHNKLEEEANSLFLPNGRLPRINQALADLDKARKEMRDRELPGTDWARHDEALRDARLRKQTIEGELETLGRDRSRLERIRDALPAIATRRTRLAEREPLAGTVVLPADFAAERRAVMTDLDRAGQGQREATEALREIEQAIAALEAAVTATLLDHADAIDELHRRLGSHQKAMTDRVRLATDLRTFEGDAQKLLRSLRPDLGLDQADQLHLTQPERLRIQELANQQPLLVQAIEAAEAGAALVAGKIATTTQNLSELEAERDPNALRRGVRRAEQAGAIQEQRDQARERSRQALEQVDVDLRALPRWSGSLDDLERLPIPAAETIERREKEHGEIDASLQNLRTRIDELNAEDVGLAGKIEQLALERSIPTEADLEEARAHRDAGWRLVRQALKGGPEDSSRARAFRGAAADLAEAFEQATRRADDLADHLRRDANHVAHRAQMLAGRKQLAERRAQFLSQLTEAERNQGTTLESWNALWQPLGVAPLSPREMRAWVRQWADLAARARALREQRAKVEALEEAVRSHRDELAAGLHDLGEPAVIDLEALPALVERCQRVVSRIDAAATRRQQMKEELAHRNVELPKVEAAVAQASEELRSWQKRWHKATERLGLGTDATPVEVAAVLDGTSELFHKLTTAASHRERIAGIDRDAAEFERDLRRMADQVAPDLSRLAIEPAAAELNARLNRARSAREKLGTLREQEERQRRQLQAAHAAIAEAESWLAIRCREAGCDSYDDLAKAEQRSNQVRALDEEIRRLEEQILLRSAGGSLAGFLAEAEAVDPDALTSQLTRLDQAIAGHNKEKETLDQTIGAEGAMLAQMDGSARAADAAEQVQALLAQVGADVEQYARLRLAALVLREGIERYRKRNQGPVLKRAGALFAAQTCGSFAGLTVDFNDKGEAMLCGIRPDGKTTVGVDGMSAGSRDQLYLALRLASLETFFERHEPLPFIVDDVLIHFDDERSLAVLKVLADFSTRTQIIFFTHHEHLLRLAHEAVPRDALFVHRLGPRG